MSAATTPRMIDERHAITRTMELTGLSEVMVREILATVERAADEADTAFLRYKTAEAPHGLLGPEEVYNMAYAAEKVRDALDVAVINMLGEEGVS